MASGLTNISVTEKNTELWKCVLYNKIDSLTVGRISLVDGPSP